MPCSTLLPLPCCGRIPAAALLAAALFLPAGGCSPPPRTVEVVGRVTYKGAPVEGATVVFLSERNPDDLPAAGGTDATGHYELSSYFSANDMPLGAVPNDYAVIIYKYDRPDIKLTHKKMRALSESGGNIDRYIAKDAIHDLWPRGAPEGWPVGYIPMVNLPPYPYIKDPKLREKLQKMVQGIPLLPTRYAEPNTSNLRGTVDWSDEPLIFDFELTDEPEDTSPPGERLSRSDLSG